MWILPTYIDPRIGICTFKYVHSLSNIIKYYNFLINISAFNNRYNLYLCEVLYSTVVSGKRAHGHKIFSFL